jgi:hypothetical protein
MAYWSPDEAIALSFGRDPRAVNWGTVGEYTEVSPFAKEYENRLGTLRRALKMGDLPRPMTPVKFTAWALGKHYQLPPELVEHVLAFGSDCDAEDLSPLQDFLQNPPQPVWPIDGSSRNSAPADEREDCATNVDSIARTFALDVNPGRNLELWKALFRKASENGLISARQGKARGRSQNLFFPSRVGVWLIERKGWSKARVDLSLGRQGKPEYPTEAGSMIGQLLGRGQRNAR